MDPDRQLRAAASLLVKTRLLESQPDCSMHIEVSSSLSSLPIKPLFSQTVLRRQDMQRWAAERLHELTTGAMPCIHLDDSLSVW